MNGLRLRVHKRTVPIREADSYRYRSASTATKRHWGRLRTARTRWRPTVPSRDDTTTKQDLAPCNTAVNDSLSSYLHEHTTPPRSWKALFVSCKDNTARSPTLAVTDKTLEKVHKGSRIRGRTFAPTSSNTVSDVTSCSCKAATTRLRTPHFVSYPASFVVYGVVTGICLTAFYARHSDTLVNFRLSEADALSERRSVTTTMN